MLDVSMFTTKVKGAMKSFLDWNKKESDSIVIETDFKHDLIEEADASGPDMDIIDIYVMDELQNYMKVKDEIEAAIRETCQKDLQCQIILPQSLTSKVSEDIVRMSLSEPCGVHGCAIFITIEDKGKIFPLSTIYGNVSTPPTFEIHLTLREDNCGWRKLHKAFLHIKGCILKSTWKVAPKILRSSYQLEKRKLYRSCSGSVENISKTLKV